MLKRAWIPVVLTVVLAASGLVVDRLHGVFGAQNPNTGSGPGVEIVQFNPKFVKYDVFGPAGTTASINYWDADANTHQINAAPVPWSYTFSTVYPSVSANIMVQGDGDQIGCRITVDGVPRQENKSDGLDAQTFCLVKSA
jgi:Mycobacterium membrane protein